MPHAVEFHSEPLAWPTASMGVVEPRRCAWRLLRRMLLGIGAADVRSRHRQYRLDVGARAAHGAGKKSSLGPLDRRAAGRELANVGGTDHSHRHRDDSGPN